MIDSFSGRKLLRPRGRRWPHKSELRIASPMVIYFAECPGPVKSTRLALLVTWGLLFTMFPDHIGVLKLILFPLPPVSPVIMGNLSTRWRERACG